jgi:hypothetical protein
MVTETFARRFDEFGLTQISEISMAVDGEASGRGPQVAASARRSVLGE